MIPMHHNLHIHTFRSNCGKPEMVLEDIVQRALAAGLEIIGLTDHVDVGDPEEIERLHADRREVEALRTPLKILVGTEVTMWSPTRAALAPERARDLDFVMIAANHYHLTGLVEQPPDHSPQAIAEHALTMLAGAIASGLADIIAHPLVLTKTDWFDPEAVIPHLTPERLAPVLRAAAERGTAMELNPTRVARYPDFYHTFIAACREHGVRFALGTDAHHLDAIPYAEDGVHRGAGPEDLAALGVRPGDLIDPLSDLPRRR